MARLVWSRQLHVLYLLLCSQDTNLPMKGGRREAKVGWGLLRRFAVADEVNRKC